jgi:hypothetical protein
LLLGFAGIAAKHSPFAVHRAFDHTTPHFNYLPVNTLNSSYVQRPHLVDASALGCAGANRRTIQKLLSLGIAVSDAQGSDGRSQRRVSLGIAVSDAQGSDGRSQRRVSLGITVSDTQGSDGRSQRRVSLGIAVSDTQGSDGWSQRRVSFCITIVVAISGAGNCAIEVAVGVVVGIPSP